MPIIVGTTVFNDPVTQDSVQDPFGFPSPSPPAPTAAPTLGSAPLASSTPTPGQGVALTLNGFLPPSAAATGLRMLPADPTAPLIGEFWYRTDLDKFSVQTSAGVKRSAAFI